MEHGDTDEVVARLRETLTYDMAQKAYRMYYECDCPDDELESFMNESVNEHYNAGTRRVG